MKLPQFVQNPGKMPQKVQKLYVLVSDSLMQVSFAGFLSLPDLYVVVCSPPAPAICWPWV
jgi:hypothetical protein